MEAKLCKQIEFYFSDANLARDKFMQNKLSESSDGQSVAVSVIASFKRVKDMTEDDQVIMDALKESDIITVDTDAKTLKRAIPWKKEEMQSAEGRCAYIKGFNTESSIDDLLGFFANLGMKTTIVRRRLKEGNFTGAVYVEFETKDNLAALKAMSNELVVDGKKLVIQDGHSSDEVVAAASVEKKEQDNSEDLLKSCLKITLDPIEELEQKTEDTEEVADDTEKNHAPQWKQIKKALEIIGSVAHVSIEDEFVRFKTATAEEALEKFEALESPITVGQFSIKLAACPDEKIEDFQEIAKGAPTASGGGKKRSFSSSRGRSKRHRK